MINKITHLKTLTYPKTKQEEGFTLLEIMVVIVIIAILVGISIPIFSTQQKNSIEATLKTDLRNAGLVMRTEATKNSGRMLSYLPSFSTQSKENQVALDSSRSNEYYYCLVGTNPNVPDTLYYSSYTGKITKTICPTLSSAAGGSGGTGSGGTGTTTIANSGSSFDTVLAGELSTKRAAIVYSTSVASEYITTTRNTLTPYGFGGIDTATNTEFETWTQTKINSYEMIVFYNHAWASSPAMKPAISSYYNQGGLVFHEGNDTSPGTSPIINSAVFIANSGATYDPTFNQGLKPTFPYTFEAVGFGSDGNWACVIEGIPGSVSVAETKFSDRTCITILAATNNNNGRYIYATSAANGFSQPLKASIQWLLY